MFTSNNMQLQIECNSLKNDQICLICNNQFQMSEARLIVCNYQGDRYGDVCPHCILKGGNWIAKQLNSIKSEVFSSEILHQLQQPSENSFSASYIKSIKMD